MSISKIAFYSLIIILTVLLLELVLYFQLTHTLPNNDSGFTAKDLELLTIQHRREASKFEKVFFSGKENSVTINGRVYKIDKQEKSLVLSVNGKKVKIFTTYQNKFIKREYSSSKEEVKESIKSSKYITFNEITEGDFVESIVRLDDGRLQVVILDVIYGVD